MEVWIEKGEGTVESRGQFTFYRSFYEAMKDFPQEQWLGFLLAVIEYGLDKKEPQELTQLQRGMFAFVKPVLDSAWRRADSGSLGGRLSKRGEKISKKENKKENETETETETEGFLGFWQRYPVKLGRREAWAEWKRGSLEKEVSVLMQGLEKWIGSVDWSREDGRYIPKPAKWLGEGWWRQEPRQPGCSAYGWQLGQAELEAIQQLMDPE